MSNRTFGGAHLRTPSADVSHVRTPAADVSFAAATPGFEPEDEDDFKVATLQYCLPYFRSYCVDDEREIFE